MPPLGMHMTVARELAAQVRHPALDADPGAYYLGATTPDIRVLTRWDRARTHFFQLDEFGHQRGVDGIFQEYPELASPAGLNASTVAFVCGYLSHLEMDETWIVDVYRPCFGERSPLEGGVLANVLDRVLQYELDRREREDREAVAEIRQALLDTGVDVVCRFIDQETLVRWREISAGTLEHEPNWERFGTVASRHLRAYGVESEEDLAQFRRNVPDLLEQSVREVTSERLEEFQLQSRRQALAAIREYLA